MGIWTVAAGSVGWASTGCGSVARRVRLEARRGVSSSHVVGSASFSATVSGGGVCSSVAMDGGGPRWGRTTSCPVGARCGACGRAARSSGRARRPCAPPRRSSTRCRRTAGSC